MKTLLKYINIDKELPHLLPVLKEAIQTDMLYIKNVDKACEQYAKACQKSPYLTDAHYVIYSPYIKETDHDREHFIFVDERGHPICHLGGSSIEIGGLIQPCENLKLSDEYKHSIRHTSDGSTFLK